MMMLLPFFVATKQLARPILVSLINTLGSGRCEVGLKKTGYGDPTVTLSVAQKRRTLKRAIHKHQYLKVFHVIGTLSCLFNLV